MTASAVGPDGVEAALATVDAVRRACLAAGEPDPLDEATARLLTPATLRGPSTLALTAHGFGFLHDGALDVAVAPSARGRGAGGDLVRLLGGRPGGVRTAWSHADHPAARVLAHRLGLVRARELWVMRRPTRLPLPALAVPGGVSIRSYRPADEADLLRVNAAAFAHHPEQGAMDAADLAARMAEPWFRADDLLVGAEVESGDRLLAFHWTKVHSPSVGEVYVVGVDPAAQGRGLGRVVTLAGLRHLAERVDGEVHLYVESDNAAARRLYAGLGFTHTPLDTHVQYVRPPAVHPRMEE